MASGPVLSCAEKQTKHVAKCAPGSVCRGQGASPSAHCPQASRPGCSSVGLPLSGQPSRRGCDRPWKVLRRSIGPQIVVRASCTLSRRLTWSALARRSRGDPRGSGLRFSHSSVRARCSASCFPSPVALRHHRLISDLLQHPCDQAVNISDRLQSRAQARMR